jgi:hypothetical protein
MMQALHAVLGTPGDTTAVSMLYGSLSSSDILAGETLANWATHSNGRFAVTNGEF